MPKAHIPRMRWKQIQHILRSQVAPIKAALMLLPTQGGTLEAAASPDGAELYLVWEENRQVFVLDLLDAGTVLAEIDFPQETWCLQGVALSPDGSRIYTSLTAERRLLVASADTLQVVAEIPLGIEPIDMAITQDGTHAYVSGAEPVSHSVSHLAVVDLVANTVLTTVVGTTDYPPPCPGLGLAPGEGEVWLGSNNRIEIVDTAAMTIVHEIDLVALMTAGDSGPACPYGITFSPDGDQVYVANYDANNLIVFDTKTRALQHKVNVGFSPTEVVVSPNGSRAYVLNSESESVSVIDASSGDKVYQITPDGQVSTFASGLGGVWNLAFGPDGYLYVTEHDCSGLSKIAPDSAVTSIVPCNGLSTVGDATPGPDDLLYFASTEASTVSRLDAQRQVVAVGTGFGLCTDGARGPALAFNAAGELFVTEPCPIGPHLAD